MDIPKVGDKVIVHYDDGTSESGILVKKKPCWQFIQVHGSVHIIDNKAVCIEKVEEMYIDLRLKQAVKEMRKYAKENVGWGVIKILEEHIPEVKVEK